MPGLLDARPSHAAQRRLGSSLTRRITLTVRGTAAGFLPLGFCWPFLGPRRGSTVSSPNYIEALTRLALERLLLSGALSKQHQAPYRARSANAVMTVTKEVVAPKAALSSTSSAGRRSFQKRLFARVRPTRDLAHIRAIALNQNEDASPGAWCCREDHIRTPSPSRARNPYRPRES